MVLSVETRPVEEKNTSRGRVLVWILPDHLGLVLSVETRLVEVMESYHDCVCKM